MNSILDPEASGPGPCFYRIRTTSLRLTLQTH